MDATCARSTLIRMVVDRVVAPLNKTASRILADSPGGNPGVMSHGATAPKRVARPAAPPTPTPPRIPPVTGPRQMSRAMPSTGAVKMASPPFLGPGGENPPVAAPPAPALTPAALVPPRAPTPSESPGILDQITALATQAGGKLKGLGGQAASAYGSMPEWAQYGIPAAGAGALGAYGLSKLFGGRKRTEEEEKYAAARKFGAAMGKQAILGSAALGGGLGAALAPTGHRLEGLGRGAVRGIGTDLGAALGMAAGGLGASAAMGMPSVGSMTPTGKAIMLASLLGGAGLGGVGGYKLTGSAMGKPSWETDKKPKKPQPAAKQAASCCMPATPKPKTKPKMPLPSKPRGT